jgi:hypothetical protein
MMEDVCGQHTHTRVRVDELHVCDEGPGATVYNHSHHHYSSHDIGLPHCRSCNDVWGCLPPHVRAQTRRPLVECDNGRTPEVTARLTESDHPGIQERVVCDAL